MLKLACVVGARPNFVKLDKRGTLPDQWDGKTSGRIVEVFRSMA